MLARIYSHFIGGPQAVTLFFLRLVMGVAFIFHGWPKIQNPLGWMTAMGGSSVPAFLQAIAAYTEFLGGIALILGLLTPLAALGLVCQMLAALFLVHFPAGHPFVASQPEGPSYESALLYLVMSVLLLTFGPGRLSVDALLFGRRPAESARSSGLSVARTTN
jgi:putative oxidoreductase